MSKSTAPTINMTPCDSSAITHHGYDQATKTMALTFKGGKTYHYADVDEAAYKEFASAKSQGTHFGKHISGKYKHTIQEKK